MTLSDETIAKRATLAAFATRLLIVIVMLLVGLMGYAVYLIFNVASNIETIVEDSGDTTTQIRETQKSSRSVLDFIKDCTEPEGKCYQASLAQQAEQAGALNAAVIAAAWCTIHGDPQTRHELTVCVGKILDGKKGHGQ